MKILYWWFPKVSRKIPRKWFRGFQEKFSGNGFQKVSRKISMIWSQKVFRKNDHTMVFRRFQGKFSRNGLHSFQVKFPGNDLRKIGGKFQKMFTKGVKDISQSTVSECLKKKFCGHTSDIICVLIQIFHTLSQVDVCGTASTMELIIYFICFHILWIQIRKITKWRLQFAPFYYFDLNCFHVHIKFLGGGLLRWYRGFFRIFVILS